MDKPNTTSIFKFLGWGTTGGKKKKKKRKLKKPPIFSLQNLPSGHEQSIILAFLCDSHPASIKVKQISTTEDKQNLIAFILQKTPAP